MLTFLPILSLYSLAYAGKQFGPFRQESWQTDWLVWWGRDVYSSLRSIGWETINILSHQTPLLPYSISEKTTARSRAVYYYLKTYVENQLKKLFIYFNWRTVTSQHCGDTIRTILILFWIIFNISLSTTKEDVQCRMINILRSGRYLNFHDSVTAFNIGEIYHLLWLYIYKI